jgi:hypothetical protein
MTEMLTLKFSGAVLYSIVQTSIENTIHIIKYINTENTNNIKAKELRDCIEENDLEFKIIVIKNILTSLYDEISGEKNHFILDGLRDIITKIEQNITSANKKITYHKSLWFNGWRNINLDIEIMNLKKYSGILNERIKLFHWFN